MSAAPLSRRKLLAAGAGGLLLSGCDRLGGDPLFRSLLIGAEDLHRGSQRLLGGREGLAREFAASDISPTFRSNGNRTADDAAYKRHLAQGFAQWRLVVDGLVRRPLALPLSLLQAIEQRAQITRHDCVEGWSAIGKWQGPRLADVLVGSPGTELEFAL